MKIALQALFTLWFRPSVKLASKKITIVKPSSNKYSSAKRGAKNIAKRNPRKNPPGMQIHQNLPQNGFTYKSKTPKTKQLKDSVVVTHREFVGGIPLGDNVGELAFNTQLCNPSNRQLFPWMSLIAQAYEKFKVRNMRFCFETAATTLANGTVFLYIDYDVTDPPPTSLSDMAQASDSFVMGPVYRPLSLRVIPSKFNQPKSYLIQNVGKVLDEGQSLLTYPFTIYYGSLNSTIEQTPGYLFVEYEVEMMVPTAERIPVVYNYFGTFDQQLSTLGNWGVDPLAFTSPVIFSNSNQTMITPVRNGYRFNDTFYGIISLQINSPGFDSSRLLGYSIDNGSLGNYYRQIKDIAGGTDTWIIVGDIYVKSGGTLTFTGNLTGSSDQAAGVIITFSSSDPTYWDSVNPNPN